jgi:hypothetical protein
VDWSPERITRVRPSDRRRPAGGPLHIELDGGGDRPERDTGQVGNSNGTRVVSQGMNH